MHNRKSGDMAIRYQKFLGTVNSAWTLKVLESQSVSHRLIFNQLKILKHRILRPAALI
jgi:hypothetical protein